jgi:putative SOS response-associated peptidase YedK
MPYYIHPKAGVFVAFAGLYDMWTSPEGEEIVTFTIITKDADPVVAAVHSRMPVILAREAEEAWLDPHLTRTEDVLALLAEPPSDELEAYPVSRRVNAARDDDPSLVQRA